MPFPLILALPLLIEAAEIAFIYIARRVLLSVAVDYAWDWLRPRLLEWVEEYVPYLIQYTVKYAIGLNVSLPITPRGITDAVNEKLGEPIFTDITDREQCKQDAAKLALQRLAVALPGLSLDRRDFLGTEPSRRRLRYKIRLFMQVQIRGGMEVGESAILTADVVQQIMSKLQEGYDWSKPVLKTDVKNVVGREMARWYTRHLTRTWVAR
jgi:hypothetical protein